MPRWEHDADGFKWPLVIRLEDLERQVDDYISSIEAFYRRLEDLERQVDDDFKFLNRNERKLFGMQSNIKKRKGEGRSTCGKCSTCTLGRRGIDVTVESFNGNFDS